MESLTQADYIAMIDFAVQASYGLAACLGWIAGCFK